MMDTTTTDGGAQAQPQEPVAVTTGYNSDQVISTDSNGTPDLSPVTSQASESASTASEAVSENESSDASQNETQAQTEQLDDDIVAWTEKKGLTINLDNPNELKLAQMQREAERKMHEANNKSRELEHSVYQAPIDYTGDPNIDGLAQSVNNLLIQNNVREFFSENPDAREYESAMATLVSEKPYLKDDLRSLYILARNDPARDAELRQAGGREALTNLAQKQQQIPPSSGATNSGVYQSEQITPQNVSSLVDKNSQEWFEKNYKAISAAMEA